MSDLGAWIAPSFITVVPRENPNVKRLILLVWFASLLTPGLSSARGGSDDQGQNQDGDRYHRRISGTEIAGAGFLAAGLIGIAGYIALRRRVAK